MRDCVDTLIDVLNANETETSYEFIKDFVNEYRDFYVSFTEIFGNETLGEKIRVLGISGISRYLWAINDEEKCNFVDCCVPVICNVLANDGSVISSLAANLYASVFLKFMKNDIGICCDFIGYLMNDVGNIRSGLLLIYEFSSREVVLSSDVFAPLPSLIGTEFTPIVMSICPLILESETAFLYEEILPLVFENAQFFDLQSLGYSACLCARMYCLYDDENCADYLCKCIDTREESLVTHALESISEFIPDTLSPYLVNSLFSLLDNDNDNPYFYGNCTQAQEILQSSIHSSTDRTMNHIIDLISHSSNIGQIIRGYFCIIPYMEDALSMIPYFVSYFQTDYMSDAISCLYIMTHSNIDCIPTIMSIVLPHLTHNTERVRQVSLLSVLAMAEYITQPTESDIVFIIQSTTFFQGFELDMLFDILYFLIMKFDNSSNPIIIEFLYRLKLNLDSNEYTNPSELKLLSALLTRVSGISDQEKVEHIWYLMNNLETNDVDDLGASLLSLSEFIVTNPILFDSQIIIDLCLKTCSFLSKLSNPLLEDIVWSLIFNLSIMYADFLDPFFELWKELSFLKISVTTLKSTAIIAKLWIHHLDRLTTGDKQQFREKCSIITRYYHQNSEAIPIFEFLTILNT